MAQNANQTPDTQQRQNVQQTSGEQKEKKKDSRTARRVRSIIIWAVVIALMIFVVFFLSYKIGEFDSIADMFRFIRSSGGDITSGLT